MDSPDAPDDLLTLAQVGETLRVAPATVERLVRENHLVAEPAPSRSPQRHRPPAPMVRRGHLSRAIASWGEQQPAIGPPVDLARIRGVLRSRGGGFSRP